MKITKEQAIEMITQQNGKLFTVEFIKKNGEKRKMNCRAGVKKHLKGGELKFDPASKNLFTVFDMQKKAYRMINLSTLQTLTCAGNQYEVV